MQPRQFLQRYRKPGLSCLQHSNGVMLDSIICWFRKLGFRNWVFAEQLTARYLGGVGLLILVLYISVNLMCASMQS